MASTSAISPARAWRKRPRRTGKQTEGGAGPAGAQALEPRGAGTLLGAGAALGWAGLCSPRAAGFSFFLFLFRERLPWVTRLRGDTALPSLQVATYRSARLITPSAAPLTRFALPAAGRADLRWRHLLGGGQCRDPSPAVTWPLRLVGEASKGSLWELPRDD